MNAILYEPNGTKNLVVTVEYAIEYCRTHSGWTWEYTTRDDY